MSASLWSTGNACRVSVLYGQGNGNLSISKISLLRSRIYIITTIIPWGSTLFPLQKEEAQCSLGLLLYSIYRFYRGVESSSKETGEWI